MGKRSRKQRGSEPSPARAAPRDGRNGARPPAAARPERPRAPWHPFPLVELCVLIGLVLLVWGLFRSDEDGGRVMLVCGMVLASPAFNRLKVASEDRTLYTSFSTPLGGALAYSGPNALLYALEVLVPQLKNATDGDKATAVTDLSNAA